MRPQTGTDVHRLSQFHDKRATEDRCSGEPSPALRGDYGIAGGEGGEVKGGYGKEEGGGYISKFVGQLPLLGMGDCSFSSSPPLSSSSSLTTIILYSLHFAGQNNRRKK